jgi:uncharacterized protein (UPF0276 family)
MYSPLPLTSGIGLKPAHYEQALACRDAGIWFEVHTENYFIDGGPRMNALHKIREQFPISFHGVGASLGGPALPDAEHLKKVRQLVDQFQPTLVSEHAVWSRLGKEYFAELLPLPRTQEALLRLIDGINCYQEAISRTILIENPTNYLSLKSEMDEADFLVEACQRTGCGLLLDVNNLFLSAHNCGIDAQAYIRTLPKGLVGEIHIAGYDQDEKYGDQLLIDSHATPVSHSVWQLLALTLETLGPKPVLLERDANIPSFDALREERLTAHNLIIERANGDVISSAG